MVNKYFFIAAFLFWLLPAIVRLCVIDISEIAISHTTTFEINSPANKTLYFLYNKDKHSAFITILKNNMQYLQPIINQYFVNNKSEIWLWSLMIHSKGHRFNGFINS